MTAPFIVETTINTTDYQVTATSPDEYTVDTTVTPTTYEITVENTPGPRGPAGLNMRGAWDAGAAYITDDAAYYNGTSYWAVAASTGVQPDTDGGTHWSILAEKGGPGDISTIAAADSTITIGGTSTDPTLKANVGTTSGTVAAGNDSRLTGLGTAANVNTGTASGTVPLLGTGGLLAVARLGSGTPDGTKFLRDDGTFAHATAGAPSWTTPTITNAGTPSGFQAVRYALDSAGFTCVEGTFQPTSTIANNTVLFTLPIGMRPSGSLTFPVQSLTAGGLSPSTTAYAMTVGADGTVTGRSAGSSYGTSATFPLNFRFHAEH